MLSILRFSEVRMIWHDRYSGDFKVTDIVCFLTLFRLMVFALCIKRFSRSETVMDIYCSVHCRNRLETAMHIENRRGEEMRWGYFTTDGQSVSMSCYRAPLWDLRPDITSCRNVAVWNLRSCFCGVPSLTRRRVCNLQCKHSMVRVAQNP
jgi:hypothetical protein